MPFRMVEYDVDAFAHAVQTLGVCEQTRHVKTMAGGIAKCAVVVRDTSSEEP